MKRSKSLLIAAILGTAYLVYLVSYFGKGLTSSPTDSAQFIGAGLAAALVMPHMVCVGVAVIFNWIGWAMKARWAALVAGILYAVSMVLMFLYALFVVVQMILCFVSFARTKQKEIVQVQIVSD